MVIEDTINSKERPLMGEINSTSNHEVHSLKQDMKTPKERSKSFVTLPMYTQV